MTIDKDVIGIISVLFTTACTLPYLWKAYRGIIKPHIFTWITWGLTTGIAAAVGTFVHAGPGAWAQWVGAGGTFMVVALSLKTGARNITRSDVVVFLAALSAIPVWLVTDDPLFAAIIVTCIDTLGYFPTFRKSFAQPYDEAISTFALWSIAALLSVAAMQTYSLASAIFPLTTVICNLSLITFVLWRRRCVPRPT